VKAYLEEPAHPMVTNRGCVSTIWKEKPGHPIYKEAMRFAPALSSLFGSSSVTLCVTEMNKEEREDWRKTILFLKIANSNIIK
jgi:hypothetical protein